MTTITLDEITRNAVLAALDERAARLEKEVAERQRDVRNCERLAKATHTRNGHLEDEQRALVWNIAALHETRRARDVIGETEAATPEQADPVTAAKAYHDWQAS